MLSLFHKWINKLEPGFLVGAHSAAQQASMNIDSTKFNTSINHHIDEKILGIPSIK